jgi:WD40 repeat protein
VAGLGFAGNERIVAWGAVGALGGTLVVWEAPSGRALTPLPMHWGAIQGIAFTAGGKEIVTAGSEGRIVRWDSATGQPIGEHHLKARSGGVPYILRQLAGLSSDGRKVMTAGPPGAIYDVAAGGQILGVPGGVVGSRYTRSFPSPDLRTVFCLSVNVERISGGTCIVWDIEERKKIAEVELPPSIPDSVSAALSPSRERLVVAAFSPRTPMNPRPAAVVTGWDLKTGAKLATVTDGTIGDQTEIVVASDTTAIVSASTGNAKIVDFVAGKVVGEIETPKSFSRSPSPIVLSPDRKRFAMGVAVQPRGAFGVRIHEWPTGEVLHTFKGHARPVSALRFSDDGKLLASGAEDATVLVWDLDVIPTKGRGP